MQNWIKSVTSTPHSPDTEAKKIVITAQTTSVRSIGQPSSTLAIFDGGEVHRRHDDAVEEQSEVDRAEAAQERGAPCRSSGSRRTRDR